MPDERAGDSCDRRLGDKKARELRACAGAGGRVCGGVLYPELSVSGTVSLSCRCSI